MLGIDYEVIKNAVCNYKSIFGRAERRVIKGHDTLIQLIKNPTGASEVLKTVDLASNIIIAIMIITLTAEIFRGYGIVILND